MIPYHLNLIATIDTNKNHLWLVNLFRIIWSTQSFMNVIHCLVNVSVIIENYKIKNIASNAMLFYGKNIKVSVLNPKVLHSLFDPVTIQVHNNNSKGSIYQYLFRLVIFHERWDKNFLRSPSRRWNQHLLTSHKQHRLKTLL